MQSIKRDLGFGLVVSVLVFAGALAWGYPFEAAASGPQSATVSSQAQQQPGQAQQQPGQAQQLPDQMQSQDQPQSKTFTGTIAKSGSEYVLRDSSGQTYKLDAPDQAQSFEGKAVTVTGQLVPQSNTIHVESIQPAAA